MSDNSGFYNYYRLFYDHDLAMRSAFEGNTEKFKEAAKRIIEPNSADASPFFSSDEMTKAVVFEIFAAHSDKAGMEAFSEVFGDLRIDRHFGVTFPARICLLSDLIAACICGNDSIIEQAAADCGRYSSDYIIYILMLCRKFDVLRRVFPVLDKNSTYRQYDPSISLFDIPLYKNMFISAAVFRDREALETLFGLGCRPDETYFYLLCPFTDTLDFLTENYFEHLGFERPPCFEELFGADDGIKLSMMYGIYAFNDTYVFERYAKEISPVKTIPSDLAEMCRRALESENGKAFRSILSDNLTVIFKSHYDIYDIFKFERAFGKTLQIDLCNTLEMCSFSELDVGQLIKLLSRSIIIPEMHGLCPLTVELLMKDSRPLTEKMISKGLINAENFRETVEFIADKKLLNALNAVNNSNLFRGQM